MNVTTTVTGGIDGNTIPYRVITVSGTTMVDADFSGIVVSGGTGTISNNGTQMVLSFSPVSGDGVENNTFRIEILDNDGNVAIKDNGFLCQTPTITLTDVAGSPHPSGQGGDVQWELWAEEAPSTSNFTSSTQISTPWVNSSPAVDTWISANAVTRTSFTNSAGLTKYYLELPPDSNFTLTSNSSDGPSMISNGGYTFWLSFIADTTQNNFTRPFTYRGVADKDGTISSTTPSTAYQYTAPLVFSWKNGLRLQIRRPSNTTGSGRYHYINNMNYGSTISFNLVHSLNLSDGSGNYSFYSKDYSSGTVHDNLSVSSMNWIGSVGYAIKNSTNTGRPFFADSAYWSDWNPYLKLCSAGWINRQLTSAERTDLLDELKTRYT
tara:strand:- start:25707 stop:26843 length:1137 start_codon:yes stop_codon:yes gene_type:complete